MTGVERTAGQGNAAEPRPLQLAVGEVNAIDPHAALGVHVFTYRRCFDLRSVERLQQVLVTRHLPGEVRRCEVVRWRHVETLAISIWGGRPLPGHTAPDHLGDLVAPGRP